MKRKIWSRLGFTLIELLVVVLIIGVLTAVAVPQYRKAVLKSRFSTLMPLAKNLWEGNEIYYLNSGEYAASVDELDVSAPADPNVQAEVKDEENHQYVRVSNPNINNRITMYQKNSPNFAGETHCEALLNDDLANWLCQESLQGTFVGNKFGYSVYTLSPETVGTLARTYHDGNNRTLADGDICIGESSGTTNACFKVNLDHAICNGKIDGACDRGTYTNQSICNADAYGACRGGQYSNYSVCNATVSGGCQAGNSFDNHSTCQSAPTGSWSCGNGSTFKNYSQCFSGSTAYNCRGGAYYNYSVCWANSIGSCTDAGTNSPMYYDDTSYCAGNFCPNGAPSSDPTKIWYRGSGSEWPNTRASELVDKPTE